MTWRHDSYRHYLAAKGVKTKYYAARPLDIQMLQSRGLSRPEAVKASEMAVEDPNVSFLESKGLSEAEAVKDVEMAPPKSWIRFKGDAPSYIRVRIKDDKPSYIKFSVPDKSDLKQTVVGMEDEAQGAKSVLFGDITRDPNYQKFKQFESDLSRDRTVVGLREGYDQFGRFVGSKRSPESYLDAAGEESRGLVRYGIASAQSKVADLKARSASSDLQKVVSQKNRLLESAREKQLMGKNIDYEADQVERLAAKEDALKASIRSAYASELKADFRKSEQPLPFKQPRAPISTVEKQQRIESQGTAKVMAPLRTSE